MKYPTNLELYVYFHHLNKFPVFMGTLFAEMSKNRRVYSFELDTGFLKNNKPFYLDPDISWTAGRQYPNGKTIFGFISDSMPDTWGRMLLKRKEAIEARQNKQKAKPLHDLDYILAVHDKARLGAIRFKLNKKGAFLDNEQTRAIPPWSSVNELQYGASVVESDEDYTDIYKWLTMLIAPGSSLGGARPKANIMDKTGHPWIAKFPSKNDEINKALWEFLAYKLANEAGIRTAECKVEKIGGKYHTFFSKRFDRDKNRRIHFASAMALTGNTEENLRFQTASYLDIVEFIQLKGANINEELKELWRRIVFNIAISNTDDHLRNHGFILKDNQWFLSPAYDLNPSVDKAGLALNIDENDNSLSFELAQSVGKFFLLNTKEQKEILLQVKKVVSQWYKQAKQLKIPSREIELMSSAFHFE